MILIGQQHPQKQPATPSSCARWYAAYTAPCREKRVFEHFVAREIESFLPLYRCLHKWKNGCRVELERPLFPGYVFVRIVATERVRVLEVPSVLSIVSRGRVPEPLDEGTIAVLRANLKRGQAEPHPHPVVGEEVSICAGPFAGLSGIVLRQKGNLRVVITLKPLMQNITVEVQSEDLEPFHEFIPAEIARPTVGGMVAQ
jgi:transcription termination/antitermination protein NusG